MSLPTDRRYWTPTLHNIAGFVLIELGQELSNRTRFLPGTGNVVSLIYRSCSWAWADLVLEGPRGAAASRTVDSQGGAIEIY